MNGSPHMHNVTIHDSYVSYGDTTVSFFRFFGKEPSERRYKRLVKKAVRKHDRGSQKAAARLEKSVARRQAATRLVSEHEKVIDHIPGCPDYVRTGYPEQWGSRVIEGVDRGRL